MRSPLLLVSILLIAAVTVADAQTAEAGWIVTPRSSPEQGRLFTDPASTPTAMVNVRESRRSVIDAPSLEEWLTRMARAEPPIAGTRWLDLEKLIKNDFTLSAQLWRVFVSTDGVKGVAIFGATTGDGRQGRIIRALIPDAREVDGPVGAKVQKLFIELMMAEQKAPPVPERKP